MMKKGRAYICASASASAASAHLHTKISDKSKVDSLLDE